MKIDLRRVAFALVKLSERNPNNQMSIGFTNKKLSVIDENTGVLFREGYYGLVVMCPVSVTDIQTLIDYGHSEEEWFACCLTGINREDITAIILE